MAKSISAALLLFLTVAAGSASAQFFTVNITFNNGAVGSGTFTTDGNFTTITSWNFTLSGGTTAQNFTTTTGSGGANLQAPSGCPNPSSTDAKEITFSNVGFSSFTTVCLKSALTASGATVDAPNSTACPGCATGVTGSISPALALIGYAANLAAGDSIIDLTNAGSLSGVEGTGDICANVYVFDDGQELIACCTCPLTPNHLQTLSAKNDLVVNPLTPGIPADITTMLVATSGACDAGNPGPIADGLRGWFTTLHAAPGGGYAVTENHLSKVTLSATEYSKMTQTCGFIESDGSGHGICGSCVQGAAGAKKQ